MSTQRNIGLLAGFISTKTINKLKKMRFLKVGDIRFNSNPKEFGSVGSKYIIFGYVFDGTKWNEMRALTGN